MVHKVQRYLCLQLIIKIKNTVGNLIYISKLLRKLKYHIELSCIQIIFKLKFLHKT